MVMNNKQVVVVATGAANTASIVAALQRAGASVEISNDPAKVATTSHVILPGVGSFGAAATHLRKRGLDSVLADRVKEGRPTLCVCVGLQLLAKSSSESPGAVGLGVFGVEVERFPSGVSVPQQGWNHVEAPSSCKIIQSGSAFYSNSYCLRSVPLEWSGAVSVHGVKFVAGVERGSVVALQFHPELSGDFGLGIIQRWLATEDASPSSSVPILSTSRKVRVVPCLDVKDGRVVKGVKFADLQDAGDPVAQALEYQNQGADELVMLDISATTEGRKTAIDTVSKIRAVLSIPLTVGGGISSVDDAANLLKAGADKVSVNTAAVRDPKLLTLLGLLLAERFGSQCVVLAIDAQQTTTGSWEVVVKSGKERTGKDVIAWAVQGVAQGAGEILLTSFDRDGTRSGYDLKLVSAVSKAVRVPIVASGGASSSAHMADAINAGADAVLAASIFHYGEYTVGKVKLELRNLNVPVRDVSDQDSKTKKESGAGENIVDVKSLVKSIKINSKNTQCLVPSIDLLGGHAVQLVGGDVSRLEINAGDPVPIAKRFGVSGEIAVVDLDAALGRGDNTEVIKKVLKVAKCRVGGGIRTVEKAMYWLNAGATKVVIGTAATPAFLSQLPRERVVVALDARHGEVVVEGWQTKTGKSIVECIQELKPHAGHFLVTFVEREGRMGGIDLPAIAKLVEALNNEAGLTIAGGITTVEDLSNLDLLGVEGQVGMALYSGRLNFADAVVAPLKSDRLDGLFPTVVVDENQVALGLCYSSSVSLREAISSQRGVYWSRSRNSLWIKGETSGATQELIGVALDCDRDTLKFTVRQQGEGFCHRETRTCFGEENGLTKLARTIFSRKKDAPTGSYTKRLFEDAELLAAKICEEAQELAEAETHDEVAWEAADLFYFALVAAAKAEVTLADISAVLDSRSLKVQRRKGDAKPQFLKQQESNIPLTVGLSTTTPTSNPLKTADTKQPEKNDSEVKLRRVAPEEVQALNLDPVDPKALQIAKEILEDVKNKGEAGLLQHAVRLGDVKEGAPYIFNRQQLHDAYLSLDNEIRSLLERTAKRIRSFAVAQRAAVQTIRLNIPGGEAGHTISPMDTVGCYAPGGRYPLPSTVLMTAVTARVAGVKHVWVASPHPDPVILAAAYIAEADAVLAVGGAQAIAAFAFGAGKVPKVDAIVGPGNRFVTAAKSLVAGRVAIDMLAGPSECLVLADDSADPSVVAADLLAQAEHDVAAVPILVSLSESFISKVEEELTKQLATLPTAETASVAVKNNGFAVSCSDLKVAIRVCDALAPEHLEVHTQNCEQVGRQLKHYGGLFLGHGAAEVLGDYGVGPNHTLPTGGSARSFGGLSVLNFLRVRTWMRIDDLSLSQTIVRDAVLLARTEGLIGHSRAAEKRLSAPLDARGTLISEVAAAQATSPTLSIPRPLGRPGATGGAPKILRFGLAKGRIMDNIVSLMKDAGIHVDISGRSLRPSINLPNYEVKLLNPRNVVEMIAHGTRDFGFCGVDLIKEMDCTSTVIPYWDTGLDPVRIVAAIPEASLVDGKIPNRHLLIATEYARVTRNWIEANGLDASIVRTYGATEVFPPEDADMIVDNSATGSTLKANRLQIVDTLMTSSTHLCVHPSVFDDPEKLAMVDVFKMLLESAKLARTRILIEFNVSNKHLEEVLQLLPSLKHPTISPLSDNTAFAVKAAVPKQDVVSLIPKIKAHGGSDILLTEIKQLVN